jgi:hypothetical protein
MNAPFFALLALDLARERAAEADAHRMAAMRRRTEAIAPTRPSRVRRVVARIALAVARAADAEIVGAPLPTR